MDKKLLKEFYSDISIYWRTKHTWSRGLVTFTPNKTDSDIVTLQRVLSNAVKLNVATASIENELKAFEAYLIKNIAIKGSNRPYISKDRINLTDDNIISLCKFNKIFTKELKIQKEQEKAESLDRGA
jgi:hypothetical protein